MCVLCPLFDLGFRLVGVDRCVYPFLLPVILKFQHSAFNYILV